MSQELSLTQSGHSVRQALTAYTGVDLPERSAFHIFRHTYATWMRREAGLDTKGLVATGAWRDRKSADRYEHVVVSEEARKAALSSANTFHIYGSFAAPGRASDT